MHMSSHTVTRTEGRGKLREEGEEKSATRSRHYSISFLSRLIALSVRLSKLLHRPFVAIYRSATPRRAAAAAAVFGRSAAACTFTSSSTSTPTAVLARRRQLSLL